MPWSTSELAELAGTTVNTIRHYHRLGLMQEPDRSGNGYKQYGVPDLVCLLRIRRLVDLGVSLSKVGDVTEGAGGPDALRALDVELEASIRRLEQARSDIAAILRDNAPADAPAGFESVAARLSEADSSIIHIYSKLYDEDAMADLQRMVVEDTDGSSQAFDALQDDADEATRQQLAERMAPGLAKNLVDYPWLSDPTAHVSKGANVMRDTFVEVVTDLYNSAQRDVLVRTSVIAARLVEMRAERDG